MELTTPTSRPDDERNDERNEERTDERTDTAPVSAAPPAQPAPPAPSATPPEHSGAPVTTLRGAGVSVDRRAVGRIALATCIVALVVAIAALFVAGAHENAQVDELHTHGVTVEATVSGCIGLMGGSGSNLVGYSCRAEYTLGGHRYSEPVAGNTAPVPGAKFGAIAVPGDPGLLATVATVAGERASWRVFVLPIVLVVVLVVILIALELARRRARRPRAERRTG